MAGISRAAFAGTGQGQNSKLHLDEAVIVIGGVKYWLCRAIDGTPPECEGGQAFLWRAGDTQFGEPRVVVSDKLRSYTKPGQVLAPDADHRAHKGLNNRVENSHRPTRKREKIFGRFKSPRHAQRFLSAHDQIKTIFRPHRNKLSAASYRRARSDAYSLWQDYTGEMNA
ncbi:transposase-like protein [Labrenzia sp. MBR-25]